MFLSLSKRIYPSHEDIIEVGILEDWRARDWRADGLTAPDVIYMGNVPFAQESSVRETGRGKNM